MEYESYYFYKYAGSPTHLSKLIPAWEYGGIRLRKLSKDIGMQYNYICDLMKEAVKEGLVDRTSPAGVQGFEFNITDKGYALMTLCKGIKVVVEDWKGEETIKILNKLKYARG